MLTSFAHLGWRALYSIPGEPRYVVTADLAHSLGVSCFVLNVALRKLKMTKELHRRTVNRKRVVSISLKYWNTIHVARQIYWRCVETQSPRKLTRVLREFFSLTKGQLC